VQFLFGRFVLDGARFELRSAGQKVEVQPKVLRLLLYLAQHSDRVVSVDELLSTLWPGETVGNASVRRAVKSARHALGETGESSATIRTAHGHGYQFISQPERAKRPLENEALARERLSTSMEEAWRDAEQARGHALLLSGEEGSGKSAALQQLADVARRRGGLCWIGRGAEVQGAPLYWPFVTVLRDALQRSALPWRELIGHGAIDIAQALPDLRQALGVVCDVTKHDALTARFRFFDSMLSFLRRVTAHTPLLLVIDDLTLADGPTIELFSFLARHAAGSRLLLAAATRPIPRKAAVPSAELWQHARHVVVPALSTREIEALIIGRWGSGSITPQQLGELIAQTAGNARLLDQLLTLCRPTGGAGMPRWEMLDNAAESQAVRRAVERFIGQLSRGARSCLEVAALLGQPFSPWVIADLLDRPALDIQACLEEAADGGLLQQLRDGSGRSHFRHGIVHRVLAGGDDPVQHQQLHARAALALERRYAIGEAQPGEIAHHFLCAGEYENGVDFSLRAARAAVQRSEVDAALRHYGQALAALDQLPCDLWRRAELLLERAGAQTFAAARNTYLEVGEISRELGSKELLSKAALGLCTPGLRDTGGRALALLRQSFEQLDHAHDSYAQIASAYARALSLGPNTELRRHVLAVAVEAAHHDPQPITRARALALCHEAMSEREPQSDRAALARETAAIARKQSSPRLLLHAASAQLRDALHIGDIQTVDVSLSMIEQLSKQLGDVFSHWHALIYRSTRAWLAGSVELAMTHAEDALQLGLSASALIARHYYLLQVSRCLRLLGKSERLREVIYEASMRYPSNAGWRCAVALSEVDVGRLDAARAIFRELMAEGIETLSRDTFILSTLCPLAELCGWVGDAEHARQLYTALSPYAAYCGTVAFGITTFGPVSRHLAIVAAVTGEHDRAIEHLKASARQSTLMASPTFICLTAVTHAHIALQSERTDLRAQAQLELKLAQTLARKHHFIWVERFCKTLETNQPIPLNNSHAFISDAGRAS
jgi:DNA-binding winged helix-turn-helix (wHTH) protein/tetratricopeptide (TPR) repeat protein